MIDWMNPSEDILEAKRIGYNEGFEAGQEAAREPTVPQLDALAEIERLHDALKAIAMHGTDAPAAANYPEDVWWRMVAYDCMRMAREAIGN